jgi:hypothetical protein
MKKIWSDIKADPVGAFLYVLLVGVSSGALATSAISLIKGCP